jgi:hypothetical protein
MFWEKRNVLLRGLVNTRLLETDPGHTIKTTLKPFLDRIGIRKDLIFLEKVNQGIGGAEGTNFFTKGDAVIYMMPHFFDTDKEACLFIAKHEVSHIKSNDYFTLRLVPTICAAAAATVFGITSIVTAGAVTLGVQVVASQYREGKADDFAIAESSDEELKGGRRFYKCLQEIFLELRSLALGKILFSSSGEDRTDILHPSLSGRIKKIETALQQRNVRIDEIEESRKIYKLKELVKTNLIRAQRKNAKKIDQKFQRVCQAFSWLRKKVTLSK